MTVHLIGPTDGDEVAGEYAAYLALQKLAIYDTASIPLVLTTDSRQAIGETISETLLCAGRAQPTVVPEPRKAKRDEAGRIIVALRERRRTLILLAAEHLAHADVRLFAAIANRAGVDVWFVCQRRPTRMTGEALTAVADIEGIYPDMAAEFESSPTRGGRLTPSACEKALPVGAGLEAGCTGHEDAVACALACFPDALITGRLDPQRLRVRLFELTRTAPPSRAWAVRASGRDFYRFLCRAATDLDLTTREQNRLRIRDVAADGGALSLHDRVVDIPAHLAPLFWRHLAVRLEEGSRPADPFLVPTIEGRRRSWS